MSTFNRIARCLIWISLLAMIEPSSGSAAQNASPPSVLFIAIDDLRPALGCFGDNVAISPHIDQLASRGTVFNRAYCQLAVCSPSRLSLLTGRRPDTIRVWDLATHFRETLPDVVTLPQHFKAHGYDTRSVGKIFHGSGKPSKDAPSWSATPIHDRTRSAAVRYALPKNLSGKGLKRSASESADVADNVYLDGIVCDSALKTLGDLAEQQQPFFLAVGFRKPHLPFCAPKKYWDLYDRSSIPSLASRRHPSGAPELATRSWAELEGYTDIQNDRPLPEEKVAELRHGYYACVSYVDALVGRLLTQLDRLKLSDNTVIVLWGDHGFHLGEQGLWAKANNYELSTRAPLIVVVPGQSRAGGQSEAFVEFVDVFPTLTDACGLPTPDGMEGLSLVPLLSDPGRSWKQAAFSQFARADKGSRHRGHGDIMGYAMRTDCYRYVEWQEWKSKKVVARELYDHSNDSAEMVNIASEPALAETLSKLSKQLARGWRGALPKPTTINRRIK